MDRISIATLGRIQRISGLAFLIFLVIHLVNTFSAILGPEVYDGFQRVMRAWYQHPLVEGFTVLLPLAVHIVAGVLRFRLSHKDSRPMTPRRRLHRYSGVFLAIMIPGHVVATRGASSFAGIFPQFEGMAFTMQWFPAYFYPYYFLFAAAGIYHAWYGVQSILRSPAIVGKPNTMPFWLPPVIGSSLVAMSLLAFGGWLYPVGDAMNSDYAQFALGFFR